MAKKWTKERRERFMATLEKKKQKRVDRRAKRTKAKEPIVLSLQSKTVMRVTVLHFQDGLRRDVFTVNSWGELATVLLNGYILTGTVIAEVRVSFE